MADHLSIGEVLTLLREEFPDITISKIRFLESQGLIDPERTPSGYRKFYEGDIERLRWVLLQQRDNYLPLKVIKGRLETLDNTGNEPTEVPAKNGSDAGISKEQAPARSRARRATPSGSDPDSSVGPADAATRAPEELPFPDIAQETSVDADRTECLAAAGTGVSMTRSELAAACDLEESDIAELESFGLLRPMAGDHEPALFDELALVIARAASGFGRHGVEPRHLRMYRSFADREAALFEQILLPYLRQRNPEARARAQEGMAELAALGRDLRLALLHEAAVRALPEA